MIARIGIADTGRDIEVAVESRDTFVGQVESAISNDNEILWFTDTKGNEVGIPTSKIAYIEISGEAGPSVGFGT